MTEQTQTAIPFDMAQAMAEIKSDTATLSRLAKIQTEQTPTDAVVFKGLFRNWLYWSDLLKQFVSTQELPPPEGKKPYTFQMRIQECNSVPNKITVARDIATGKCTFSILAEALYTGEKKDKTTGEMVNVELPDGTPNAKAVLKYMWQRRRDGFAIHPVNAHSVDMLMDENGEFRTHIWHTFSQDDTLTLKRFAFDEKRGELMEQRSDGSPKYQDQTPIQVERIHCTININPYISKNASTEPVDHDDVNPVLCTYLISCGRDKFAYMVEGRMHAITTDETGKELTLCERIHANEDKNKRVLVPFEDVQSEKSRIPYQTYWWIETQYQSPDGLLGRVVVPNLLERDFYYEKSTGGGKDKKERKLCYVWNFLDIYGPEEQYSVRIRASDSSFKPDNPAHSFGVLNAEIWPQLCLATMGFPCHVFATFNKKTTNSCDYNMQLTAEERMKQPRKIRGIYHFYADKVIPDFTRGLPEFGIPISQQRMQRDFADAAKNIKEKKDRCYTCSKDDDGDEVIIFKSQFSIANPLHSDGERSAVVNFGCGTAVAFDSSNAVDLLPQMDFYVLTTHDFGDQRATLLPKTTEEGDKFFDQLLAKEKCGYQIYGLRRKTTNPTPVQVAAAITGTDKKKDSGKKKAGK